MIKPGMYVMLGQNVLALVDEADDKGFHFRCENSLWYGRYDNATKSVKIDEHTDVIDGVEIVSVAQPPAEIVHGGYNAIIPWMLNHK